MSLIEAAAPAAMSGVMPGAPQVLPNPDVTSGESTAMSAVARSTLDAIGSLQSGFDALPQQGTEAPEATVEIQPASEAVPEMTPEASMQVMADQFQTAIDTQMQLAHFSMTSSVSSSLGRNLNMFLRGQ